MRCTRAGIRRGRTAGSRPCARAGARHRSSTGRHPVRWRKREKDGNGRRSVAQRGARKGAVRPCRNFARSQERAVPCKVKVQGRGRPRPGSRRAHERKNDSREIGADALSPRVRAPGPRAGGGRCPPSAWTGAASCCSSSNGTGAARAAGASTLCAAGGPCPEGGRGRRKPNESTTFVRVTKLSRSHPDQALRLFGYWELKVFILTTNVNKHTHLFWVFGGLPPLACRRATGSSSHCKTR